MQAKGIDTISGGGSLPNQEGSQRRILYDQENPIMLTQTLLLALLGLSSPAQPSSGQAPCIGPCECACAPEFDIYVCQGSLVTKVKIIWDPPGPNVAAVIKSFAKTEGGSSSLGDLSISPSSTWGDVDECSDILCDCD